MGFEYDLVVIGAGPAGEKAAVKAAYFGKRVALIEREPRPGGACLAGGLPSKILRESALAYQGARRQLALEAEDRSRILSDFSSRVDLICQVHDRRVRDNLARHGVELIAGTGVFCGPHELEVRGSAGTQARRLSAEIVVIATGGRPLRPAFIPFDDRRVFSSESILSMRRLPRSITVVGAGLIGCEYASMFSALDVEVHLVDERQRIIGFLDEEIAERLLGDLRGRGMRTHLGRRLSSCVLDASGEVRVGLDGGTELVTECLLYSGGRAANTQDLALDRVGVALGEHGRPIVDEFYRTTVEHVYAVGDVIGFPALASTSMEQGRVAVGHAFKFEETLADRADLIKYPDAVPYPLIPYGIYTIPSVSMVGQTEEQVRASDRPYVVGKGSYSDQDRGQLLGDVDGLLKLICDRETRKVLGVHIVGHGAEELIHIGQACMHFGGTIEYFLRSVFNFPTLAGLYKAASYDVLTRLRAAPAGTRGEPT